MAYVVQPLSAHHDRRPFDCGEPALNDFLQKYARQNQRRGIGRTYVAVPEGEARVVGYYTLAAGSVAFADVPEQLRRHFPRYPVPVVHLGRLATCQSARGEGLGGALLVDALARTLRLADELGVAAIEVRAKTERARGFYAKYGFESMRDDPLHMYLPIQTVEELLAE